MKRTATIVVAAVVALVPATGEAAKAKSTKRCPQDAFCVWSKPDYQGKKVVLTKNGVSNKIANQMNNRVSSTKNKFDLTVFIYDKRGAKGEIRCFSSNSKEADLGGSYNFDNRAASSLIPKDPEPCF